MNLWNRILEYFNGSNLVGRFLSEHAAFFNWSIAAAIAIVVLYAWFRDTTDLFTIDQFGYIEGKPDHVMCERCGSNCNFLKNLTFKKDGTLWTEWSCPRCVKLPV